VEATVTPTRATRPSSTRVRLCVCVCVRACVLDGYYIPVLTPIMPLDYAEPMRLTLDTLIKRKCVPGLSPAPCFPPPPPLTTHHSTLIVPHNLQHKRHHQSTNSYKHLARLFLYTLSRPACVSAERPPPALPPRLAPPVVRGRLERRGQGRVVVRGQQVASKGVGRWCFVVKGTEGGALSWPPSREAGVAGRVGRCWGVAAETGERGS
jgi:hypothetical protein